MKRANKKKSILTSENQTFNPIASASYLFIM